MVKTFLEANSAKSIQEMEEQLVRGYQDFKAIAAGDMSDSDLLEYVELLVSQVNYKKTDSYFWVIGGDILDMPSDTRVEFVYKPTYIASSIIMYSILRLPSLLENTNVMGVIPYALNGCLGRDFRGHGYEAEEGFVETMEIFTTLKVYDFIKAYPRINLEFTVRYKDAVNHLFELFEKENPQMNFSWLDKEKTIELKNFYSRVIDIV